MPLGSEVCAMTEVSTMTPPKPRAKAGAPGVPATRLERLLRRKQFLAVAAARHSAAAPGLVLQARKRKGVLPDQVSGDTPRLGYTASKKVGNAVARNRAKRRLRAAAALVLAEAALPLHDYVLVARQATVDRPWSDLLSDLRQTLKRLAPRPAPGQNVAARKSPRRGNAEAESSKHGIAGQDSNAIGEIVKLS